jgi:hypothetical protein
VNQWFGFTNLSIGADSGAKASLPTYKPHHTCNFEVPLRSSEQAAD